MFINSMKMFIDNMKMKPKLTVLFLLVGLIPLIIVGWWSSRVATNQLMYVTFKCITTGIDITAMTSTLLPI